MPRGPFRFLHTSDLHLEQPLSGVSDVPEHLRQFFLDAPYHAAQRVFDAALKEDVQLLLLAGDVVNLTTAGARAASFLYEQFERLRERKIAVYWVGGAVDAPERWPNSLHWPDNVTVFPVGRVQEALVHRDHKPICAVLGVSHFSHQAFRPRDFRGSHDELFTIALAHGTSDAESLVGQNVNYWALGGQHACLPIGEPPLAAQHCGTIQGRSPAEPGPHGCILGHVDADGRVRTQFVPVDEVRYLSETLTLEPDASRNELAQLLREQSRKLSAESGGRTLIVSWTVLGGDRLAPQLRRGPLVCELLEELQREFGHDAPAVWTHSLASDPHANLPTAWYEEQTILGDYLRHLQAYESGESPLEWNGYLGESEGHAAGKELTGLGETEQRHAIFRAAALLGSDLLRSSDDDNILRPAAAR